MDDGRMVNTRRSGWSMMDGLMMSDNDRPTMTDTCCVQRKANADNLAAVWQRNAPANGCSGNFFFNIFYDLKINSNIILISVV